MRRPRSKPGASITTAYGRIARWPGAHRTSLPRSLRGLAGCCRLALMKVLNPRASHCPCSGFWGQVRTNPARRPKSPVEGVANDLRGARSLFADDLNHDFTAPRSRVELQHGNLLPLTEQQLTVTERNRYGGTEQRRADVAGTVVVAPAQMMLIFAILRCELLKYGPKS